MFLFAAIPASATTYYVDYSAGLDTNAGTSKTVPFKHAPQMQGCTNTCSMTTPVAGDSIIFKGGVTWPAAALGWCVTFYGAFDGSNQIYIGVDPTWYTGGSWTRPIFNGGGSVVTACSGGTSRGNTFIDFADSSSPSPSGITIDNIEFTGAFISALSTNGSPIYINQGVGSAVVITNNYFHGWTHGASTCWELTPTRMCNELSAIYGGSAVPSVQTGNVIANNVMDGTDSTNTGDAGVFCLCGTPTIYQNIVNNTVNGYIVNGAISVHDNTTLNLHTSLSGIHENCFEDNASEGLNFYNNVCGHLGSGALGWWFAPVKGYVVNAWNNVLFDTDVTNVIDLAPPVPPTGGCPQTGQYCTDVGTYNLYNNTVECGPDSNPQAVCADNIPVATADGITFVNSHFITGNATPLSTCSSPCTNTNSLVQAKGTACGSITQPYVFFPTSSGCLTNVAGTNLTSTFTGALASGLNDTTYACTEVSGSGGYVVSCPARTAVARVSTLWNIGAYQYGGAAPITPAPCGACFTDAPNAPTNLKATAIPVPSSSNRSVDGSGVLTGGSAKEDVKNVSGAPQL